MSGWASDAETSGVATAPDWPGGHWRPGPGDADAVQPFSPRGLLGFVHLEKAAGTSVIHVLRSIFPMRYWDARPVTGGRHSFVEAADLRMALRLHPGLACFGGHGVVPFNDLHARYPGVRFLTILRDPVERCLSHLRFWIHRSGMDVDPVDFLGHFSARNFQVRKIAGEENLELAKRILHSRFALVGTLDRYDEFLALLAHLAGTGVERIPRLRRNVAKPAHTLNLPADFEDRVREQNQLDAALFRYAATELREANLVSYPASMRDALERLEQARAGRPAKLRKWADSLVRHVYLNPLIGQIRVRNGMTRHGIYAGPSPQGENP